jgi:hypothetical protein
MKGPRTYQFDAPTSFITSISRRRAKIERTDRVGDQDSRRGQEDDHDDPEHDLDSSRDLEDSLRDLLAVAHGVDRWEFRLLDGDRDRLGVLTAKRDDVERGRQWVRGEVGGQLGVALAHDPQSTRLRAEGDAAGLTR